MGGDAIDDKMKLVQNELNNAKESVRQGLVKVIERGDRLESISVTADNLQIEAGMFKKNAKRTRIHFCIQQWKMIALCLCILGLLGISLGLWTLNIGATDEADTMMNSHMPANDPNLPNPVGDNMETGV